MKFYNREKEIETITSVKNNFRIAIIGRRRVGKTTLVEHVYKNKCITLFVPAEKAEKEIISGWVKEYEYLHLPNVNTFKDFFDFIFFHEKDKVIFIDEMQNILKVNKSFLFDLQRLIDKYKPSLVITGSLVSIMKKIVENYKSPLYGRFDFIIKLKELDFKTIYKICQDLGINIETSICLYSIFGGIPKYYELIEKLEKFEFKKLIIDNFILYPRPLYEEVKTMLKEEFGKENKTFFSILSAISQGKNKHYEIAGYLGKKQTDITKYMAMLQEDFELIKRELPAIGGKRGIYEIKNNIISFWFSSVWQYNQYFETGQEEKVAELVGKSFNKFISFKFEKIIYELISLHQIILPCEFTKIGRQWGKFRGEEGKNTYELDLVALNEKTNEILFVECKWQDKINAEEIVKELAEKSNYINWNNQNRKESFAVFAKSFNRKISEFKGKKVYCFDLKDVEKSLNTIKVS